MKKAIVKVTYLVPYQEEESVEDAFGMSYDEFMELSGDEKEDIINTYKDNKLEVEILNCEVDITLLY